MSTESQPPSAKDSHLGIKRTRRGANLSSTASNGLGLILTSSSTVGGLQIRFAALSDVLFGERRINGRMVVREDVLGELRKLGFRLEDEYVVPIPRTALTRHRVGVALWVALHVLRSDYAHVHLASNPSPLSWLLSRLRRWFPPFSVSIVDSRVQTADVWMKALQSAHAIDCLSPSIAGKIVEKWPTLVDRVRVAPTSFPARPQLPRPSQAVARDIDVLFVGRFVKGKGIELLDAVGKHLVNVSVHLVGAGPLRPIIPGATFESDDDVFGLMLRSKIFLSLQLETNYPSQAIYEAVGAGCALIVTDTGDTRRFLDDHSALLVPPQPAAIVESVTRLLRDSSLRVALAETAQERLRDHTVCRFADYLIDDVVSTRRAKRMTGLAN